MIKVTGCRILVKPLKLEQLDETAKRLAAMGFVRSEIDHRKEQINMDKGIVLQVGPKVSSDYTEGMEVGDKIGFTKFGGKFVRDTNSEEDLLVINDEDVICVYKE